MYFPIIINESKQCYAHLFYNKIVVAIFPTKYNSMFYLEKQLRNTENNCKCI